MAKHTAKKVEEKHREDAVCNTMQRIETCISKERKEEKRRTCRTGKREGKKKQ
jgi:hypothetical protein